MTYKGNKKWGASLCTRAKTLTFVTVTAKTMPAGGLPKSEAWQILKINKGRMPLKALGAIRNEILI